jgi:hypothetical protein
MALEIFILYGIPDVHDVAASEPPTRGLPKSSPDLRRRAASSPLSRQWRTADSNLLLFLWKTAAIYGN